MQRAIAKPSARARMRDPLSNKKHKLARKTTKKRREAITKPRTCIQSKNHEEVATKLHIFFTISLKFVIIMLEPVIKAVLPPVRNAKGQ